jgi:hypothetical protein
LKPSAGLGARAVGEERVASGLLWKSCDRGAAVGTRTTYICDCCYREADTNLGWARIQISGASGKLEIKPDETRDLCEVCWGQLQTLMEKISAEAREKRNSSPGA